MELRRASWYSGFVGAIARLSKSVELVSEILAQSSATLVSLEMPTLTNSSQVFDYPLVPTSIKAAKYLVGSHRSISSKI